MGLGFHVQQAYIVSFGLFFGFIWSLVHVEDSEIRIQQSLDEQNKGGK
jgi:hypothetical protein